MKTHYQPVWSRRKTLGFAFLLSLGLPAFAQQMPLSSDAGSAAQSDTDKAIAAYIKAAGEELDAFRAKLNVTPPLPHAGATSVAKDKLARCDELLTKLKAGTPGQFDTIKAQYEAARGELTQATDEATRP